MDSTLRLLGIACKAGRLAVGEEPVAAAARAHQARVLLLAEDAAANSVRRALHLAEGGRIPAAAVPFSKAELGRAVGRSACAVLAVTEPGLAHAVARRLAALRPEEWGALAEQLAEPARRALERQKEQRRHEKKMRRNPTPWAPPPVPPGNARGARKDKAGRRAAGTGAVPRGGPAKRKKTP